MIENIPNSMNGWNGNTVNMQRVRCLKITRTVSTSEERKKERKKPSYLAIIGSPIDLRRQTLVLATREMVALENRFLSQHTSSSHLHHLLRLLRYLRHLLFQCTEISQSKQPSLDHTTCSFLSHTTTF